jgi:hypothetical protein
VAQNNANRQRPVLFRLTQHDYRVPHFLCAVSQDALPHGDRGALSTGTKLTRLTGITADLKRSLVPPLKQAIHAAPSISPRHH